MNRRFARLLFAAAWVVLLPCRAPAPLYHVSGEGWYYEPYGQSAHWQRPRAKEQLEVAQKAFDSGDYDTTLHAAHRILRQWPLSDYAPDAQYLVGRALEAEGRDESAFKAYQEIIDKYPRSSHYDDVLWRQYAIATRFLGGQWFKLWGFIPFFPSMDKTADMFDKIVNNGPYSVVAPHAQLRIGAAREKQKNYPDAVKAYATAADRYYNQPTIAADAVFREGISYARQAARAEYDQGTAGQAIATFTDFVTLYPEDKRVPRAQKAIAVLKTEQVRGNFQIARFYEKSRKWNGAVVYYNEVLQLDPNSAYAAAARERIEALKSRIQVPTLN
ncbi:MAG TPA: tetratricopeptide repeat protein [Candidatus Acidoferrum sp.]|nr:tetratricopeptide repeat protein [Candidatus Acidoferrum sp.]